MDGGAGKCGVREDCEAGRASAKGRALGSARPPWMGGAGATGNPRASLSHFGLREAMDKGGMGISTREGVQRGTGLGQGLCATLRTGAMSGVTW